MQTDMALFWKITPPLLPSFGYCRKMGGGEDGYYYFTDPGLRCADMRPHVFTKTNLELQRCQTYGLSADRQVFY